MDGCIAQVVVAGGGPAGATVARLLALKGRNVLLIDPAARAVPRLEILPPAALGVAEAIGVTGVLSDPDVARACLGIRRRWGRTGPAIEDFLCHPRGRGFVIDRTAFDARLLRKAAEAGVDIRRGRVIGAQGHNQTPGVVVAVSTSHGRSTVTADTVIDATGRPAAVARRLGARQVVSDRRLAELRVDNVKCAKDGWPVWLEVQSADNGWAYRLSGPRGRFQEWHVAEPAVSLRRRNSRYLDASSRRLSPAAGADWLAIGDAAVSFDPITSQGLFNALSTALVATGLLIGDGTDRAQVDTAYTSAVHATADQSDRLRASVYASLR